MKNSLVTNAQAVLYALFKDVRAAYPTMSCLDRDRERLLALIKTRGLESLSLDLPNLDKLLLRGLETGRLVLEGPYCCAASKRIRVPRLFSGLWLRVFDGEGSLRSDPDINALFFIRVLSNFYKSLELKCSDRRKSIAVEEYYDVEGSLRSPTLLWGDSEFDCFGSLRTVHFRDGLDDPDVSCVPEELGSASKSIELLCDRLQRICDSIAGELGYYDPYEFTNSVGRSSETKRYLGHGRGSVSDLSRHADKYALPNWSERLQRVFPNDAFGHYRFDNTLEYHSWKESQASKLIAVPKTLKAPRLIASEPTSHQWCQKITLRWLIQRMKETRLGWFLDLSNQKLSRDMVLLHSVPMTGDPDKYCATVDLSSASDRLSCWAVERAFRRNPILLDALMSSRTPILNDGITGRDAIFLKKFATQGTGVTFPIQSIFFLACVLASLGCNSLRTAYKFRGRVRVYGDDIIIPKSGYENLRLLLSFLQLKVNEDKSFLHGQFRESCGMDAFRGHNVTPIKPKTLVNRGPKSEQAMLDMSNNLHKAGLWHTAAWFESTIRKNSYPIVGILPDGTDLGAVGRVSYCGSEVSHLKMRWNPNYQRYEVLCRVTVNKAKVKPYNSTSGVFQFFAENPSPLTKWESGQVPEARPVTRSQWVDTSELSVTVPSF